MFDFDFYLDFCLLSRSSVYTQVNTDETVTGNGRIYPGCTAFGGIYFIQLAILRISTSRENVSQ